MAPSTRDEPPSREIPGGAVLDPRFALLLPRVREFFAAGGALAQVLGAGYEARPEQAVMAEAVLRALATDDVALVEAGTGTGKTLAYLVPAVLWSGRLVVSTHTRNLQDQVAGKDVPLLERALGRRIGAVVMKGLANYLCLRRYQAFLRSGFASAEPRLDALSDWVRDSPTGDRSEIEWLADDDALWREVCSGPEVRIGARCAFFEQCFVTRLKRRAAEAPLVVANHHLFFADLAVPAESNAGVLPPWEAVVFDEAHALEEAAAGFFGAKVSSRRLELFRQDVQRRVQALDAGGGRLSGDVRGGVLDRLDQAVLRLGKLLERLADDDGGGRDGDPSGGRRRPLGLRLGAAPVQELYRDADAELDRLEERLKTLGVADDELSVLAGRLAAIRGELADVMSGDDEDHVSWAERMGRGEGGEFVALPARGGAPRRRKGAGGERGAVRMPPGITVGRTPLDVAGILRELLYSRGRPVVFTSATLADHRGFGFVRSRFGLDDRGTELKLDSPFDFERQALLYVPDAGPEPNDAGFLDGVFEQLQALLEITGGGALVLFTSYKNQRAVAQRLRAAGAADLLVQGEAPRAVLIDRLRERRDAVLLATASFWQGVDVAGEALRLVVIDKLPFDSPGDPVVAARIERFKRGGGDAFREFQVPTAALALRQGFGRLIRSRTDRGLVAILDRRLRGKWYGRAFLQALPKCGLTASLDEAREWWRGGTPTRKKKRGAGAPPGPSQ